MPTPPVESRHDLAVLRTYRFLRLAMVALVGLLFVAVGAQIAGAGCVQTSVSAYYFTAAHGVFIAALCAIGVALIVYQGSSASEDIVLNFSGFFAFVVAFVPTAREPVCGGPGLPSDLDVGPGARTSVLALMVVGVVVEAARLVTSQRETPLQGLSSSARRAQVIGWALCLLGAIAYVAWPARFLAWGHAVAAVTMFVGIIYVVFINAWSSEQALAAAGPPADRRGAADPGYVGRYKTIAWAMAITLAGVIAIHLVSPGWQHLIITTEVLLIVEFAAFWLVETAELWNYTDRGEMVQDRRAAAG